VGISSSPCPFHFSDKERAWHDANYAAHTRHTSAVERLKAFVGCAGDVWVSNDHFDEARRPMEEVKHHWDADVGSMAHE